MPVPHPAAPGVGSGPSPLPWLPSRLSSGLPPPGSPPSPSVWVRTPLSPRRAPSGMPGADAAGGGGMSPGTGSQTAPGDTEARKATHSVLCASHCSPGLRRCRAMLLKAQETSRGTERPRHWSLGLPVLPPVRPRRCPRGVLHSWDAPPHTLIPEGLAPKQGSLGVARAGLSPEPRCRRPADGSIAEDLPTLEACKIPRRRRPCQRRRA